ncbi:hypothetical protein GF323_05305 [Candidatus Woesearchaeota archaeon]|nr:hypothetical protein [Candidatus Woesearchaeota archaeon]
MQSIFYNMKNKELSECWNILPKVSRSFSLCIKLLPHPLDDRMMLSYLIFRIVDTIEDSEIKKQQKKRLFDLFLDTLSQPRFLSYQSKKCSSALLQNLTYSYEEILLRNLDAVLKVYFATPEKERTSILRRAKEMAEGMYKFQTKTINTFDEQNEYCYYAAGLVGYLFNDLFFYNNILSKKQAGRLIEHAKRYGLALQKVNIIRDIVNDAPDRKYWPIKLLKKYNLDYKSLLLTKNRKKAVNVLNEMIKDALPFLDSGIDYVKALPRNALKVRVFCLIPLFMAVQNFVKCINNRNVFEKKVKLTRPSVAAIVRKSYLCGYSNFLLDKWYNKNMKKARASFAPA